MTLKSQGKLWELKKAFNIVHSLLLEMIKFWIFFFKIRGKKSLMVHLFLTPTLNSLIQLFEAVSLNTTLFAFLCIFHLEKKTILLNLKKVHCNMY